LDAKRARGSDAGAPQRSTKKPGWIDHHVGKRMRMSRSLQGLSQEDLAHRLGITAQQIQKYETGETRVSASRLYDIGVALGVSVTWFFADVDPPHDLPTPEQKAVGAATNPDILKLMVSREAKDLLATYFQIEDPRVRKKFMQLLLVMVERSSA
jgi:transcriptional regulator with XRE-family HTH domain